jgi:hypothetical protein
MIAHDGLIPRHWDPKILLSHESTEKFQCRRLGAVKLCHALARGVVGAQLLDGLKALIQYPRTLAK